MISIAALMLAAGPPAEAAQDPDAAFLSGLADTSEPVHFSGDRFTYNLKSGATASRTI